MSNEHAADDVLVKVVATIIVRVPNHHPDAQATDGLNEMFREAEAAGFIMDWGYAETGGQDVLGMPARAVVLELDPDSYEEGDAWGAPEVRVTLVVPSDVDLPADLYHGDVDYHIGWTFPNVAEARTFALDAINSHPGVVVGYEVTDIHGNRLAAR